MAGSTDAGGRGSGSGSGSGSDSDNAGPTPVLARCSAWSPTARCPLRCPARAGAHLLGGGGAAHDSQPGLAVAHAGAVLLIPRPAQHPPQLPLDAHQRRGQGAQPARSGGGGAQQSAQGLGKTAAGLETQRAACRACGHREAGPAGAASQPAGRPAVGPDGHALTCWRCPTAAGPPLRRRPRSATGSPCAAWAACTCGTCRTAASCARPAGPAARQGVGAVGRGAREAKACSPQQDRARRHAPPSRIRARHPRRVPGRTAGASNAAEGAVRRAPEVLTCSCTHVYLDRDRGAGSSTTPSCPHVPVHSRRRKTCESRSRVAARTADRQVRGRAATGRAGSVQAGAARRTGGHPDAAPVLAALCVLHSGADCQHGRRPSGPVAVGVCLWAAGAVCGRGGGRAPASADPATQAM